MEVQKTYLKAFGKVSVIKKYFDKSFHCVYAQSLVV